MTKHEKQYLPVVSKRRGVGQPCTYCRREMVDRNSLSGLAATRDHYVPKSKGGREIVLACRLCNSLKKDMLPGDWEQFMADFPVWWEHHAFKDLGTSKPKRKYTTVWEYAAGRRSHLRPELVGPGKKATKHETNRAFAEWTAKARRQRQEEGRGFPIVDSRMIMRHGKDYWKAWKERGEPACDCCRLSIPVTIPIEYSDPKAQAAFEGAYRKHRHMLRVAQ